MGNVVETQEKQLEVAVPKSAGAQELAAISFNEQGALEIKSMRDADVFAKYCYASGLAKDAENSYQIGMKLFLGKGQGMTAQECINDIYIRDNQIGIFARLVARRIKQSDKYDYKIRERSATACTVEFFEKEKGEFVSQGSITITMEECIAAGITTSKDKKTGAKYTKKPWLVTPARMLFFKVITEGYNLYTPDVLTVMMRTVEDIDDGVEEIEKVTTVESAETDPNLDEVKELVLSKGKKTRKRNSQVVAEVKAEQEKKKDEEAPPPKPATSDVPPPIVAPSADTQTTANVDDAEDVEEVDEDGEEYEDDDSEEEGDDEPEDESPSNDKERAW